MAQPPNPRASLIAQRVDNWNRRHPGRPIDVAAELAVARQEGLSGGVGDNGTSFGPNQLHYGGAYPSTAPHGAAASQAWAWSPEGLDYTLGQIANVAGGEHGAQAVRDIVTKFERPADPGRETANALAAYGSGVSSPMSAAHGSTMRDPALSAPEMSPPGVPSGGSRRNLLLALAQGFDKPGVGALTPLLRQLTQQPSAPPPQPFRPLPSTGQPLDAQPLPARSGQHVLAELLHEGVGGPTHSTGDHIHVALTDPQAMLAAIREAQQLGLSVRENPYVDPVDPVHAPNSFHKRDFPGLYNGRKLGEALDVHGPRELEFQKWVQQRYSR